VNNIGPDKQETPLSKKLYSLSAKCADRGCNWVIERVIQSE